MNQRLLAITLFASLSIAVPAAAATPPEAQRLTAAGRSDEALAVIDAYLQSNQQDTEARIARGEALLRLNRTAEATRVFTELHRENPLLMEPYRQLGLIYLQQGDYARARDAFETVLKHNPDDAAAQASLGDVYLALAGAAYDHSLLLRRDNAAVRGKQRGVERLLGGDYPSTDRVFEPVFSAPTPLGAAELTATNLAPPPSVTGTAAPAPADLGSTPDELLALLNGWLAAWSSKDLDHYLAYYADNFRPEIEGTREAWAQGRRNTITNAHGLRVSASAPRLTVVDATHARLRFEQHYRADLYEGNSMKTLDLVKTEAGWRIARERVESD